MPTIFWAGDSTCQQNYMNTYPQTGIAQVFDRFTKRGEVTVSNHAINGRSTKSFLDEGRLVPIYDRMEAGDFLFIQFGHNDEKEQDAARYAAAFGDYAVNLEKFVNAARNKGAIPVIITPCCRRLFSGNTPAYRHTDWAESARQTAARLGVACVDLTAMSEALVQSTGIEESRRLYMCLEPGAYPNFPDGQNDNSHLRPEGAMAYAGLIAGALWNMGGAYAALIAPEAAAWLQAHGTVDADAEKER